MMRSRLLELAERRARLQQRAAGERAALAAFFERTDQAAALAERIRGLVRRLRGQPALVAGLVAFFIALRPRRALGWLAKGWSLWRMYRGAQRWWQRFEARASAAPARA